MKFLWVSVCWGVVLQSSAILRFIYAVLKYRCHWREIHFLLHYETNFGRDKKKFILQFNH